MSKGLAHVMQQHHVILLLSMRIQPIPSSWWCTAPVPQTYLDIGRPFQGASSFDVYPGLKPLGYSLRPLRGPWSLDISGRQKLGKFENFLWSKFFAGLEKPVRVMTCENGVIIRSGP